MDNNSFDKRATERARTQAAHRTCIIC